MSDIDKIQVFLDLKTNSVKAKAESELTQHDIYCIKEKLKRQILYTPKEVQELLLDELKNYN